MKRLLLIGGGHAHLEVIRQFGLHRAAAGTECTLASPDPQTIYTGMLPGVIAGHYAPADLLIDVAALARAAGWRFIPKPVKALDLSQRAAILADGSRVNYDILSLDTGSVANLQHVPGAALHALPIRPFAAFLPVWQHIVEDAVTGRVRRIMVVGAGAGGVEVVLAMAYRLAQAGGMAPQCSFALVTDAARVLVAHAPGAQRRFGLLLEKWRITLHCGSPVVHVEAGAVKTARGEVIEANRVIWATTGAAPNWPKLAGLAADAKGFVAVDATLRSTSNAEVFGGGDVVSICTSPHPKSGVYAVRQGPVLAANLRAALTGRKLKTYMPQTHALSLISAGGKHAVATWGSWSVAGDWVWRWKDRIDRAFVAKYVAKYAVGYRNLPL